MFNFGLGHALTYEILGYRHDSEATDAPCPYLTTFHGAYTSDDSTSITLILELMDGGELQEFVSDGAHAHTCCGISGACRLSHVSFMVYQGADALSHCWPTRLPVS